MEWILIFSIAIFLFINFAHSQYYEGALNTYDSQYVSGIGSYTNLGKEFSQSTNYQQQPYSVTITEEVVQSPSGTTKVITTQQQQQSPYGSSRGNFGSFG